MAQKLPVERQEEGKQIAHAIPLQDRESGEPVGIPVVPRAEHEQHWAQQQDQCEVPDSRVTRMERVVALAEKSGDIGIASRQESQPDAQRGPAGGFCSGLLCTRWLHAGDHVAWQCPQFGKQRVRQALGIHRAEDGLGGSFPSRSISKLRNSTGSLWPARPKYPCRRSLPGCG